MKNINSFISSENPYEILKSNISIDTFNKLSKEDRTYNISDNMYLYWENNNKLELHINNSKVVSIYPDYLCVSDVIYLMLVFNKICTKSNLFNDTKDRVNILTQDLLDYLGIAKDMNTILNNINYSLEPSTINNYKIIDNNNEYTLMEKEDKTILLSIIVNKKEKIIDLLNIFGSKDKLHTFIHDYKKNINNSHVFLFSISMILNIFYTLYE